MATDDIDSVSISIWLNSSDGLSGFPAESNLTMADIVLDFRQKLFTLDQVQNILLFVCYVPVFVTAAIANSLIIIVVLRYRHLRSVTNYFLVNLSVADLLVTVICMPMAVSSAVVRNWLYGFFMCKFTAFLQGVAVSASVFSIAAMSLDRYLAIRHPMIFRQVFNKTVARCVILVIWIVASLLFVPLLFVRQLEGISMPATGDNFLFCVEKWPETWDRKSYSVFLFVAVYAIPSLVILAAYISMGCKLCAPSVMAQDSGDVILDRDSKLLRGRRRVARTLMILAFVFALCWLPYNSLNLALEDQVFAEEYLPTVTSYLLPFTLLLGHANSAANPLLYCFFSRNFRQRVLNIIRRGRRKSYSMPRSPRNKRASFLGRVHWNGYSSGRKIPGKEHVEEEEESPMTFQKVPAAKP